MSDSPVTDLDTLNLRYSLAFPAEYTDGRVWEWVKQHDGGVEAKDNGCADCCAWPFTIDVSGDVPPHVAITVASAHLGIPTVWWLERVFAEKVRVAQEKHDHDVMYADEPEEWAVLDNTIDVWEQALALVRGVEAPAPRLLTLRDLQEQLPWSTHYHHDFRASPVAHKDFGHALTHIVKATGKLAAVIDDAEHRGSAFTVDEVDRYVADLVICALRLANTVPGRPFDLQTAVETRIETKNGMVLKR